MKSRPDALDTALRRQRRRTAWGRPLLIMALIAFALGALWVWQNRTAGTPAPTGRTPSRPQPTTVSGPATVIDGDTLDIRGKRIRLYGIDAPEHDQTCRRAGQVYPCGQEAVTALRGLLAGKTVGCRKRDTDRYGRVVAVCTVDATDVNGWMALRGHALAYREYGTDYVPQENAARKARRGMHAGSYVNPADFRNGGTTPAAPATSTRRTPYTSCAQARAAGQTPVLRGEGGYNPKLDGDADGKMCETRR